MGLDLEASLTHSGARGEVHSARVACALPAQGDKITAAAWLPHSVMFESSGDEDDSSEAESVYMGSAQVCSRVTPTVTHTVSNGTRCE